MASVYFSINRGQSEHDGNVVIGAASSGGDVELRVDQTKSLTRNDILRLVKVLQRVVVNGTQNQIPGV